MSYSIIFDTKFIKLSDGRLLHLDRSGCNNDTSGRNLSDYTGKIYTVNKLKEYAESYIGKGNPCEHVLKIKSKWCSYSDYGKHLLRMAKRAKTYEKFNCERYFSAKRYDGVNLFLPEEKTLTPKEFSDCFYDYLYSGKPFSYRRILTLLNSESEIINTLENGDHIQFYVGKKYKVA